jgi:hypothetical protein
MVNSALAVGSKGTERKEQKGKATYLAASDNENTPAAHLPGQQQRTSSLDLWIGFFHGREWWRGKGEARAEKLHWNFAKRCRHRSSKTAMTDAGHI